VRRLALILVIGSLTGCVGDLVELTPPMHPDAGATPQPDLSNGNPNPGSDGGGTPQSVKFNPDINNDILMLGCAAATCHGGTQVPLLKNASDATSIMANYNSFTPLANTGANSPVLTENLSTSGITHTGGKPFADTSNAVYQRWLGWINAGNPP
jgi:hypothetical protein